MKILVLGEEWENEENCYPDSNLGDGIDSVKSIRAKHDSRVACESFYVDNGSGFGNRAALLYDLPKCVKACVHQNSDNPWRPIL